MALFADINCGGIEIHLPDNTLLSYHYYSDTDGFARAYPRSVKLELVVDVLALLSNRRTSLEENKIVLESLRTWGNQRFEKDSEDYYRSVVVTQTHGDILFRKIEFSHAYVENFTETVELAHRLHCIKLELLQRDDKLQLDVLERAGDT